MITKTVSGSPEELLVKRKARIKEALEIKFADPKEPVKYVVDTLYDGTEVYFIKPGKEYFRKNPNLNDMTPNVGTYYKNFNFSDIWELLCKLYNTLSPDNYKKLSVIIYRIAYLMDFGNVGGKVRFILSKELNMEIRDIQMEANSKNLNINVLSFLYFLDVLGWNEDVKYHTVDAQPDFSDSSKRKNGRINTLISCISIPMIFQKFVDEVLKSEGDKTKIDYSAIISVAQKFARTRGVQPLSNKELVKLFSPYLT